VLYAAGLIWLDVAQFHFERSVRLAQQGNLAGAVAAAERARALDPAMTLHTFQSAYLHGQMADQPGASEMAVALYQAGLAAEPVDGRQTANLAAALWQTDDHQAAIDTLARAIAARPNAIWLMNLGYFHQQVGNLDSAIEAYGQALARSPELAASEFWQADAERAAHWPDILAHAEAVQGKKGAGLVGWRLQIALAQHNWRAAGEQAQAILEDSPRHCVALSALARAKFETGSVDEAMNLAQRAIDAWRACGNAYLVRGLANQAAGELAAAEKDWRTAIFFDQQEAAYYLGQLYQKQGDSDAAARLYLTALPPTVDPILVEVALYSRKVAFDLLPPLFRIGVGPAQAAPWLKLAELREAEGDLEGARLVYETLLAKDPYLGVAQERLDALSNDQ
jgi:tetratricopeptide (TPR) repeat protein